MFRRIGIVFTTLREASPKGRMARAVVANIYDKAAFTLVQIVAISILTRAWGADGYGVWLMLSTVPSYIALSDLGLGTAAGVLLTQSVAKREFQFASRVLQSTIAFVMGTVTVAAIASIAFSVWYYCYGNSAGPFSKAEIAISIALITVYAVLVAQMSVVTVVYRATHKFAFAMVFAGTMILLEGSSVTLLALGGLRLWEIALANFLIRLSGYLVFVVYLKRVEPWVVVGIRGADRSIIKELASPSLAALGLTFANAGILQGVTLALGVAAGPAVVALFGVSRTLSRLPLQISGLFVRPAIIELTRAVQEGNLKLQRQLTKTNVVLALLTTVPFGSALILIGPWLVKHMSGSVELTASHLLFVPFCFAASMNALWTALAAPIIAANRQAEFSYLYLALALLSIPIVLISPWKSAVFAATLMAIIETILLLHIVYRQYFKSPKNMNGSI